MESVMNKIRQAREEETKRQADKYITEAIVDGCNVKIRFAAIGDSKVLSSVQSMLISAHMDAAFKSPIGGGCA